MNMRAAGGTAVVVATGELSICIEQVAQLRSAFVIFSNLIHIHNSDAIAGLFCHGWNGYYQKLRSDRKHNSITLSQMCQIG